MKSKEQNREKVERMENALNELSKCSSSYETRRDELNKLRGN